MQIGVRKSALRPIKRFRASNFPFVTPAGSQSDMVGGCDCCLVVYGLAAAFVTGMQHFLVNIVYGEGKAFCGFQVSVSDACVNCSESPR